MPAYAVINGETYKLALLPSGVLRHSKLAVIGNGWFSIRRPSSMKWRNSGARCCRQPGKSAVAENVTLIFRASRPRFDPRNLQRDHRDRHHAARHRAGL